MATQSTDHPFAALSRDLADIVAQSARSVVGVCGRGRLTSSGFVWRAGTVVTASDALERDDDIVVLTPEGKRVPAALAGRDPSTDIAVLRVEEAGSPWPSGSAGEVLTGELALAIGRSDGPLAGLAMVAAAGGPWQSLRGGRIDRLVRLDRRIDARLEGGVLVNSAGSQIGMAVLGPRRAGLAIPAQTIDRVAEQLLARGRVSRGYLGLGLQPVRLDDAPANSLSASRGLIVVSLDPNGPGKRAGLLIGDVITAWNGEPLRGVRDVLNRLGPDAVGRQTNFSILRAGQSTTASIEISERPMS
jgi:S1-C subfamily serine protease